LNRGGWENPLLLNVGLLLRIFEGFVLAFGLVFIF
jgi:hypothetical protein